MEKWLQAIMSCYSVKDGDSESPRNFTVLNDETSGRVAKVLAAGQMITYGWSNGDDDYVIAAGVAEPVDEDVLQDKLSDSVNMLIGNMDAGLYAVRDLIIDDMKGMEVCGGIEFVDGEETIFYAVYLSDGKEGYLITGFGSGEPEVSFDELCGAARTFYRGEQPATFFNGKATEEIFESIRCLASETRPSNEMDWDIANITFSVEDGKMLSEASVILISDKGVESLEHKDIFGDKNFSESLISVSAEMPNLYDISGFTVTNFRDGRYGVTFYPLIDDEEHDHDCQCGHDHSHNEDNVHIHDIDGNDHENLSDQVINIGGDIAVLEPCLKNLSSVIVGYLGDNWKHGMGYIKSDGDYLSLSLFSSKGESFKSVELPEEFDENLNSVIDELNAVIDNEYEGWNVLAFTFDKLENSFDVDLDSVCYEVFGFDLYVDGEECSNDDENAYLLPVTRLFYDELNKSDVCVSAITFKVFTGNSGFFVIEPAAAATSEGLVSVTSFNDVLPEIKSYIDKILEKQQDVNTVCVTLFPEGRIGFSFELTDEPQVINRSNLSSLLEETGLSKYSAAIESVARDEILALHYEVDAEESLVAGSSKIGGSPDLPLGTSWPFASDKKPMTFVAQINLGEVSASCSSEMLPNKGLLSFFYYEKTKECKVIYSENTDNLDVIFPMDSIDETEEFFPARMKFVPSVSFPYNTEDNGNLLNFLQTDEDEEAYYDISACVGKTKLFGYADIINSEIESTYHKPVKLLFQIASVSECNMNWGDDGVLYFWIYEDDLKERRFDKCWCVMQSY